MKNRNGFVSNSSSSSFIVLKQFLSPRQLRMIKDHIYYADKYTDLNHYSDEDAWDVNDDNPEGITLSTPMTNFPMDEFLQIIGVPSGAIINGDV